MKVKNWINCVQDRGKWKGVVEKAITFKHERKRRRRRKKRKEEEMKKRKKKK